MYHGVLLVAFAPNVATSKRATFVSQLRGIGLGGSAQPWEADESNAPVFS